MESGAFEVLRNPDAVYQSCIDEDGSPILLTDVVVIGNGPSGLALSAFLAGWKPFYNKKSAHPSRVLHQKLLGHAETSLVDQELSCLEEYCAAEDGGRSAHPLSVLYDSLVRPDADLGHEHASSLRWEHKTEQRVPHVVIGAGPPGGSWNDYDDDIMPLSLSTWLDLPGFGISQWLGGQILCARLPCLVIRKYFKAYPKHMGIRKNLLSYATVTNVQKFIDTDGRHMWDVRGNHVNGPFHFRCKKVVLATGLKSPRMLNLPGEAQNERVLHDLQPLKQAIFNDIACTVDVMSGVCSMKPVLVVGDGITAADSVLHCLANNIPVIHLFRRSQKEIKSTLLGRLSNSIYPEYQSVVRLMVGREVDALYQPMPQSSVVAIDDAVAEVKSPSGETTVEFRYMVVCIGRRPDLHFLPSVSADLTAVHPLTYESPSAPGLYCVGPLAGDNFVRFLVGGCLGAARHIIASCASDDQI
uniref:FAD/NAD(P)-binding domain-containing protein n=1 Tax=Plectus sambesii TaxID=2011161 RepID=A0A914WUV0_9BILA